MPSANMPRTVAVLCLLATVAGCDDPAIERGVPPILALNERSMSLPLYSYAAARRLREGINGLANGETGSLRASIRTESPAEAQAARVRLIENGIAPTSITVRAVPDNVVVVSRVTVRTTSCQAALRPGYLGDSANSVDSLGRCVQANNLAAMVADPAELVAPASLAPMDGAVAARAVLDWQKGVVKSPPSSENLNNGAGQLGDTGSIPPTGAVGPTRSYASRADGSSPAPAQSAPASGATPSNNPLLAPGL